MSTFAYLGIAYLVVSVGAGACMQNPPAGYVPEGWTPNATAQRTRVARDFTFGEALQTWQWYALWLLLFLNTSAGIAVISQEAPIFHELGAVTPIVAAGMVGIASIGNACGRVFWAFVSDYLTRRFTFLAMFLLQAVLYWVLPTVTSTAALTALTFVMLMCYGGGFGTMPAFAADYFGPKFVGPIYGLMLTAWGVAGAFGPTIMAYLHESSGNYASGLHVLAAVLLISSIVPFLVRPPLPSPEK